MPSRQRPSPSQKYPRPRERGTTVGVVVSVVMLNRSVWIRKKRKGTATRMLPTTHPGDNGPLTQLRRARMGTLLSGLPATANRHGSTRQRVGEHGHPSTKALAQYVVLLPSSIIGVASAVHPAWRTNYNIGVPVQHIPAEGRHGCDEASL